MRRARPFDAAVALALAVHAATIEPPRPVDDSRELISG
jgi:hypothetical protein